MSDSSQLKRLFLEDSIDQLEQALLKWQNCLGQLSTEQIWWRHHPHSNSLGNLALHICGNLRQWTFAGLKNEADTRDRESEFMDQPGLDAERTFEHLAETVRECAPVIRDLSEDDLTRQYVIQGFQVSGLQAVNHTVTHFVGHTHQAIFITRLQLGDRYRFAWSSEKLTPNLPI